MYVRKLFIGAGSSNGTQVVGAAPQGTRVVEEGLPHRALKPVGCRTVLVAVAEPLTVFFILQVLK